MYYICIVYIHLTYFWHEIYSDTICGIFPKINTDIQCVISCVFWHILWQEYWHIFWHIYFLTCIQAYLVAYLHFPCFLTYFLVWTLTWHILRYICFWYIFWQLLTKNLAHILTHSDGCTNPATDCGSPGLGRQADRYYMSFHDITTGHDATPHSKYTSQVWTIHTHIYNIHTVYIYTYILSIYIYVCIHTCISIPYMIYIMCTLLILHQFYHVTCCFRLAGSAAPVLLFLARPIQKFSAGRIELLGIRWLITIVMEP